MGLRASDIIASLIFNLIHCAYAADHFLSCNVTDIEPCPGDHQMCNETSHQCQCLDGFTKVGADCVLPDEGDPPSHGTAALVTIFTLGLVTCGLVLVIRKYNLIDYVRQKLDQRRNNDVMYEDVMIGQDDPPLSP